MNASNKRKTASTQAKYAIAALIAGLIGMGTVYLLFAPSDNGSGTVSAPSSSAYAGPLKGLNTGHMAAFVIRPEPEALPAFSFLGPDGNTLTPADFKGKVVLLNIWATWCVPCREEMPQLNELQAELGGDKFEVVALNMEKNGEEKARAFLEETKATDLALYADPTAKVFSTLRVLGMPTTLLVDAEGRELGRLAGEADWASPEAKALVQAAIAAP